METSRSKWNVIGLKTLNKNRFSGGPKAQKSFGSMGSGVVPSEVKAIQGMTQEVLRKMGHPTIRGTSVNPFLAF
jgi:hypothetical protein